MAEVRWLDDDEQRAWRGLMGMQEGLADFIDRQLRVRCGLSHADFQVLAHLSEAPKGRLRSLELGRLLHWEKGRLSQHLSRMQARGMVSRERCVEDRRGASTTITPRGRELIEFAARQHVSDARSVVIDELSSTELASLTAITDKVRARLAVLDEGLNSPHVASRRTGTGRPW